MKCTHKGAELYDMRMHSCLLEKPTFWISNCIFWKKIMLKGRKIMKKCTFFKQNEIGNGSLQARVRKKFAHK